MKTTTDKIKVTKINTGIYSIAKGNKIYQARKNGYHGQWELFEMCDNSPHGENWIQTYVDFGSCKICVQYHM